MSSLFESTYNPDVLSCIANLSNDEVFTPPEVANQVLDLLPSELWSDPNATFLDPACKSGIFLREIAKRLIDGLEDEYPDLEERLEHIYKEQLFGIAITELTSLLSRRSVYCSKYPNSAYSVVRFDDAVGNVRFKNIRHKWVSGRCVYCGAAQREYDRDEGLEQYAYEFIHVDDPEEVLAMKFDVIIGNPPYQLSDGGGGLGSSAVPIYQKFVEQAKKMNPRYLIMIVPARWQSGGRGLDAFRDSMLSDDRVSDLVTFADSRDCFQGVDIAGGVCYFLWKRDRRGLCNATYVESGTSSSRMRRLNQYPIFIPSNSALDAVEAVRARSSHFYDERVSAQRPFGIRSSFEDINRGDLNLRWRGGMTKTESSRIEIGREIIEKWKVIISKSSAEHAGQSDSNGQRKVLTVIEVLSPNTICSETYLVVDSFDTRKEAENLASYLRTRFARYLILQATPTQNISKGCFIFLPIIDLKTKPNDDDLFDYFGFSDAIRKEIVSKIKPMQLAGDNDADH